MQFTNEQKLIAAMLAEVHQALKIRDGINSDLVSKAIWSDNTWAINWGVQLPGMEEEPNPPYVKHVVDVLDMWGFIEEGYERLDEAEKKRFAEEGDRFGEPRFPGFDGNNEAEYLSAAKFLIKELDRFQRFADRADLNSHHPTLQTSRRMLDAFLPLRAGLGARRWLSVDDLIAIFRVRQFA